MTKTNNKRKRKSKNEKINDNLVRGMRKLERQRRRKR